MFEAQLITALPTPFTADERLDTSGLATLTTWIRDSESRVSSRRHHRRIHRFGRR